MAGGDDDTLGVKTASFAVSVFGSLSGDGRIFCFLGAAIGMVAVVATGGTDTTGASIGSAMSSGFWLVAGSDGQMDCEVDVRT